MSLYLGKQVVFTKYRQSFNIFYCFRMGIEFSIVQLVYNKNSNVMQNYFPVNLQWMLIYLLPHFTDNLKETILIEIVGYLKTVGKIR